ncbi:MATE family efflux transporter [Enterobacter asburiae]|uniref:MATE family efflux transporter n=1 Tax=Enterobacter asburiae TaxID=61645 RepID=UPI001F3B46BB|nr:MATE family efflux transporter [Enterobacter asburiae]
MHHWQKKISRKLLFLTFPIALQTLLFSSKGLVDNIMLIQLGERSLAAVSISTRIIFVIIIFLSGLAMGGGQIAAQQYGSLQINSGDYQKISQTVAHSLCLQWLFTLPVCVILLFKADLLLCWIVNDADIKAESIVFLQFFAPSLIFINYSCSLTNGLRAMQQPYIGLWFSAIGVVSNIAFNYLFIFGSAISPPMGIAGAALGTVFSCLVEAFLLFIYLFNKKHPLARLPLQKTLLEWGSESSRLYRNLTLSLQLAANSSLWALGTLVTFSLIGHNDPTTFAALAIISAIESWSLSVVVGFSCATSILIGSRIGMNQFSLALKEGWYALWLSITFGVIISSIIWLAKPMILSVYPKINADVMFRLESLYNIMAIGFICKSGVMVLLSGILRGGGDNKFCMSVDILAQWGICIPLIWWLSVKIGWVSPWIYALLLLEDVIKLSISMWRLASGRWQHKLLSVTNHNLL